MSPQQTAQIRLRLDMVAAQRAKQAAQIKAPPEAVKAFSRALARAATPPPGATMADLVKGVVKKAKPVTNASVTNPAAKSAAQRKAAQRAKNPAAAKAANAKHQRASRAKKAGA